MFLSAVAYLRDECLQTRIRSWVETGRYHQRLIGFWERVLINNTPPEPFHKASATNESSSSKPRAPTPNRILAECAKNTHFGRPITPPPPPATRTYSLPREQALKATNLDGLINPPARANSRSPGVGVHQTRGVHSHPDDYNHASTSFVSGYLSNPASSYDSSEPSGIEEGHVPPLFGVATQLEMRPRRLELVWRETQRRWRDKHGTTLPRWQDKDFRLKIEGGYGIEDDVPVDRAWRDMWNDVNNCWLESEVLWRMRGGEKAIQSHPNYLNLAHRKLDENETWIAVKFVDRAIAEIFSIFEKNGTDMSVSIWPLNLDRAHIERKQLKKGKRDASISQILTNLRPLDAPLIGTKPLPLPVSLLQPNQTARAESDPVLETNDKPASPPLAPRVYISYNQAQVRVEGVPMEPPQRMDESAIRRVDAAVGAKVAAAAAETFDRAENKKRLKEAELRAQEERRVAEEQLAREQRRAEEDRRLREEQRAEEAWRREAVERQREERARYEYQKRESEDRKRRWAADPLIDRGSRSRQPAHEPSVLDAWNAYELRWSALSASSPNQLIGFRDIPWPLLRVPSGPESITPQAVGAFILSPLHSQDKSRKERLRNAMLRWHSDKFEGRWMARIEEDERPKVKEAVRGVFTSLVQIMNGSEFSDGKAKPVIISVPQEPAVTIGKHMSVQDIIGHLAGRGCQDLTAGLDLSSFSECPNSHGGFSDVYRGRLSTGAHIAVKALRISTENIENPKHLKRAARELYTWSNCKHPNVLQLLGLAVFRGRIGMVSPWMDHGTLPRYLDGNTEMDRCNLCVQICDGLAYLHETGIVHGDLKGANVLALADGTPVLTDFGNSIFLGRTLLFTETTREGSLTGRWAAPELLEGSGQPSKEADIYALGM
ncbi:hypothetical protein FRC11_008922, partial [Ceratobasidium sp. 423]